MTVDHESDVPVYVQLAGILRGRIASGELAPHRPLPSIRTLMQEHGVADRTARKAVDLLIAEGLAHTVTGKGTFVTGDLARLS
jgi:GntR family transcriptional regulator